MLNNRRWILGMQEIAAIAPVGIKEVNDEFFFDTSWGRFIDIIAKRYNHVYTRGRPIQENVYDAFTYKLNSCNVKLGRLLLLKSSLHTLPQTFKLLRQFCRMVKKEGIIFIRGI